MNAQVKNLRKQFEVVGNGVSTKLFSDDRFLYPHVILEKKDGSRYLLHFIENGRIKVDQSGHGFSLSSVLTTLDYGYDLFNSYRPKS